MKINPVISQQQIGMVECLADEIWWQHFTPIIGDAQVDYMLNKFQSAEAISEQISDGYLYFLFENNDENIGYMAILFDAEVLFLSKLYICRCFRHKGYASLAMVFLQQLAVTKSVDSISLTVNRNNTDTINIYKKLGFVISSELIKDIGGGFVMDDYVMEKNLRISM